jgi:hypothetical protein
MKIKINQLKIKKMLDPKILYKILSEINDEKIHTTFLLTTSGTLLSSATNIEKKNEKIIAAIVSGIHHI